ncbi:MAG: hypothetical protein AAF637_01975 [Pseudomonadota bacterium]
MSRLLSVFAGACLFPAMLFLSGWAQAESSSVPDQTEFSRSYWKPFNMTHEGKKYCVVGIIVANTSTPHQDREITAMYLPELEILLIVADQEIFDAFDDKAVLWTRHSQHRLVFSKQGGMLTKDLGGDLFPRTAQEGPLMKARSGDITMDIRTAGFANAYEKSVRYCDLAVE